MSPILSLNLSASSSGKERYLRNISSLPMAGAFLRSIGIRTLINTFIYTSFDMHTDSYDGMGPRRFFATDGFAPPYCSVALRDNSGMEQSECLPPS